MEITLHTLFQSPVISGMVSQFSVRDSFMQRFFGMQVGGSNTERQSGRNIGWDIFNKTRTLAKGRAPNAPPVTIPHKPVGHVSTQCFRLHEKIPFMQDAIFRTRPFGAAIGTVDLRGQQYVARQVDYGTQRFRNAREFMVSRIPRGGFGVIINGEDHILTEKDDANASYTVNYQIPGEHFEQLALGQNDANLITEPWDDPSADVIAQLLRVNATMERIHSSSLRHVMINSNTFSWLLNNIGLQNVGGQVYRIFESLKPHTEAAGSDGKVDNGFDVIFRALPLITFHVYDGVLNVNSEDSMAAEDCSLFIEDDHAVFLPEPDATWATWIEGSEIVAENVLDMGKEVFGFHNWTTRVIDPPGWEMKLVDNGIPAIKIPRKIMYPTIRF